jgi:hypothetical protein
MINTFENNIILNISDDITGLKRQAKFDCLIHNVNTKQLPTNWTVNYYLNDGGDYGELVTSEGIKPYSRQLIADNNTLVDATKFGTTEYYVAKYNGTDFINVIDGEIFTQADIDANPNLYGEFDFFCYISATQPIIIDDLITSAGQLAADANRF